MELSNKQKNFVATAPLAAKGNLSNLEQSIQEEGKEGVDVTEGSVIPIPEGIKDWHGAAKTAGFNT